MNKLNYALKLIESLIDVLSDESLNKDEKTKQLEYIRALSRDLRRNA